MKGSITKFFGQALTGQGLKDLYQEIAKEAEEVYFLKGIFGFNASNLLKEIGYFYVNRGFDIEFFYDPLFENTVQATFVKGIGILFLQSSKPSIEPTRLGTRDHVISFYDCLDKGILKKHGQRLKQLSEEAEEWHHQLFDALRSAIEIHDEWERQTRKHMDWKALEEHQEELLDQIFDGMLLNKTGTLTHRLFGTLTPVGARDFLQNITRNLERRYFIKGLPGTGKSTMLKKLAQEALKRGFDVQQVWCGLDARSIDMVILPELKFCIFDSTAPHEYFPAEGRVGDQIVDIAKHCPLTKETEEKIQEIEKEYRGAILHATNYAKLYAEAEKEIRGIVDLATDVSKWKKQSARLFGK
ncbi:nucleotide kinase [Ureibacillus sp. FSL K6-8385]|uniref:Nucleotide kinase n=1 Tax=Ureibacillus terrenus TaxID=118246 RepID=A0A540V5M7_9BACL|nr:nucleotide kinase [Ureibacillus terrenus]MED3661276.1 nucleotide kinase [Ureibacillus terrenus]MED3764250.1 nucleotide kinase [Ureibacillus terrenus]TQE92064.1 nucleotide kinase [Ureibacillus terrenus]